MDRETFFRALPFLSPVTTENAWPPRISGSLGTDIILKNHLLSVEPMGPACFEAQDGPDSAMFHIDICIVTTTVVDEHFHKQDGKNTSPAASSVSTSLSMSQSPKVPSQTMPDNQEVKRQNERMHIVFRVDRKHVFQVDLARFQGVELNEKPLEHPGVPNLVVKFDSCLFRVFSEEALSDNGSTDDCQILLRIKTAASRMKRALSTFQRLSVFQENEEFLASLDQTTDSTSTIESAQYENRDYSHEANNNNDDGNSGESSSIRRVKRKRSSLDSSWNALKSLQVVLSLPHNVAEPDSDGAVETIGPLLTHVAEELASSYSSKTDSRAAMQSCTNDLLSCETQLTDMLSAAFPPPTRNRRNSPAKTTQSEEHTEALLETVRLLLQKQKDAVKQRLELSLLPIRN